MISNGAKVVKAVNCRSMPYFVYAVDYCCVVHFSFNTQSVQRVVGHETTRLNCPSTSRGNASVLWQETYLASTMICSVSFDIGYR